MILHLLLSRLLVFPVFCNWYFILIDHSEILLPEINIGNVNALTHISYLYISQNKYH